MVWWSRRSPAGLRPGLRSLGRRRRGIGVASRSWRRGGPWRKEEGGFVWLGGDGDAGVSYAGGEGGGLGDVWECNCGHGYGRSR
jgi:hypothetical protein